VKILLIQPKKPAEAIGGEEAAVFEPIELGYVAAGVMDDHDVKILDMRIDDNFDTTLNSFQPDIIGITSLTVHVNTVKELFKKIKAFNHKIFTVVGGHHATILPEDFMVPSVDMVVIGEGVFAFRELVSRLEQGKNVEGIPGTAYSADGKIIINRKDGFDDLDSFPFPDRSLTRAYRSSYFTEWLRPLASIRTSKGCKFRCKYCAQWKIANGQYLTRKPECIVEELSKIEEDCIFFADDESLLDVDRMMILADLIKKEGLKKRYCLYGRSDTITKHPDLIETWKDIGLERVCVGLEFFRDKDLKSMRKGASIKTNVDAINVLKSLDVEINPCFIVRQDFDKADFGEFRNYCLGLKLNLFTFTVLTPLPGTDFYEEVKEQLVIENYDYYDFIHTLLPTKLPVDEFYQEFVALYTKTVLLPDKLRLLRKYPLRNLRPYFKRNASLINQVRNVHRDYMD